MSRQIIVCLIALLLMSPASAFAAKSDLVSAGDSPPIGFWYGEGQPTNKDVLWLSEHMPNGGFIIHFRICSENPPRDQIETGTWSYANGVETIYTTIVDGMAQNYTDQYVTESYDGHRWTYRHLATGAEFSAVRVDKNFQLPDCGSTS